MKTKLRYQVPEMLFLKLDRLDARFMCVQNKPTREIHSNISNTW
jgi:hypothetical protein